jgi:hypothetical protein
MFRDIVHVDDLREKSTHELLEEAAGIIERNGFADLLGLLRR